MAEVEKRKPVAYVPFKTFLTAIEAFEHSTLPHQIDTSVWQTYSGAVKSQLLGSFKFLGLIGDGGHPTAALKSLVEDKANRKTHLRKVIESGYPKIVSVGLQQMTPKQFDDLMREYGMEGSTHQKVVSFFVKAAKYAEIPMSPLLGKRTRVAGRKRRTADEGENGNQQAETNSLATNNRATTAGTSKAVTLKSGGQLSLMIEANVFELSSSDRQFVFGMIDKLQEYERSEETAGKTE